MSGNNNPTSAAVYPTRHSSSGGSLFNSSAKGDQVHREWRSATDGSVITSSAKVGIAVAQQRAPPVPTVASHSSHDPIHALTSSGGVSLAHHYSTAHTQPQFSLANSFMDVNTAAAAALDLTSLQQFYNQAVANLPLSLPTAANLHPTISLPVAYWPAMQLPTAAAVQYQQALGNILRSSSGLSSSAASAFPGLLQQPAAAAALAALGSAAASLPPISTSSGSLDPLLGAAVSSHLRAASSDWAERSFLGSASSPTTLASASSGTGVFGSSGQFESSLASSGSHRLSPELGKVYAYNRKGESLRTSTFDASLPLSVATSSSSVSSFGKALGYVRRPDPHSENSSLSLSNRELSKSEAPKINLPTRSLTIPADSFRDTSSRPLSVQSTETPKTSPHVATPPLLQTTHSNHSNDVLLPPKMRGKASQMSSDSLQRSYVKLDQGDSSDSFTQRKQSTPISYLEAETSQTFSAQSSEPTSVVVAQEETEALTSKVQKSSPITDQTQNVNVNSVPTGSKTYGAVRGRPRDTSTSNASNYIKCVDEVVVQYQKLSAEGRLADKLDVFKRLSETDPTLLSPSAGSPGFSSNSKLPDGRDLNSTQSATSHLIHSSNFAFDPSEFTPGSANSAGSSRRQVDFNRSAVAAVSNTDPKSDDDDDFEDDDDDESISSDSTICPESPPLVISYTKETLNEFCTRQYQSFLDDVEQPLKQVLASEDEDTAAKRKLIVLEQRVKRKLKMKFAGYDSEAKRAKVEAAASAVAIGSSTFASLTRMSELSAMGSVDENSQSVHVNTHKPTQPSCTSDPQMQHKPTHQTITQKPSKPAISTKVLQRKKSPSPGASLLPGRPNSQSTLHYKSDSTSVASVNAATSPGNSQGTFGASSSSTAGHHESLRVCTAQVADSRRSVHLSSDDLVSGQRVLLRQPDGLYAPGKLIAMQPPDVYGVVVDGARGSKPQIFAYEDLVKRAVLEIVPKTKSAIPKGTKVCAHYSKSFNVLHPGTVSTSTTKTLPHAVKIDFDDGDESIVNLADVRVLSSLFNPADYNILNPTYSPTSGRARVPSVWKWDRKCLAEAPIGRNVKAFYTSICKSNAIVSQDDFVAFHNSAAQLQGAVRKPYIGRVLRFFETTAGECLVKVTWYYRTDETKQGLDRTLPKNALLRSSHSDDLDIQTISHRVEVLDEDEYANTFNHNIYKASQAKGTPPDNLFVCAGTYDHLKGVFFLTYKKPPSQAPTPSHRA